MKINKILISLLLLLSLFQCSKQPSDKAQPSSKSSSSENTKPSDPVLARIFSQLPAEAEIINCPKLKLDGYWLVKFNPDGTVDFNSNLEAMFIKGKWKIQKNEGIPLEPVVEMTMTVVLKDYADEAETEFKAEPASTENLGPFYITRVTASNIIFFDGTQCGSKGQVESQY